MPASIVNKKEALMSQEKKSVMKVLWKERKSLWDYRHLTVEDALEKISRISSLKFLLTSVGIWVLVREIIIISILVQLLYWFCRFSKLFF